MLDMPKFIGEVHRYLSEAVAPLLKRIEDLEENRPVDGKDVVRELLATDDIRTLVNLEAEAYLKENPPAAGKDGEKGMDGAGIADLMIDRDGNLTATFTDGRMKSLGVIVGKDGAPGRDGVDGRSVENLTRRYVPESHEIVETWRTPDGESEIRYPAGGIHHKGYWSEKVKVKGGESWTHNGTLWIANEDTADEPSPASKAWTIGARKGRDGKDGRNGIDRTKPVKVGSDA